ncbi:unnamed protein product [Heligmosomoides polygyrus]|uniref:Uncharacterized protein n=1 Tax=Heligmosomoides polygyrus TaxID=6339 RepID=A0A183FDG8_HELPZ|nr:unnamed protein product [Heligmosomoides polygyrus]
MAEEIVLDCEQVRLLQLYEFKKQSSARIPVDNTWERWSLPLPAAAQRTYGSGNGDFCLVQPRSERPVAVNEERVLELVQGIPGVAAVNWQRKSSAVTPP